MSMTRTGRTILAATVAWGLAMGTAFATDITFWTWRQEDRAAYNELFADFTKSNPDINVTFESFPDANYATIVSTALAAGKGGDVIHTHAYGWLEQFAAAGYFTALNETNLPSLANVSADSQISGMYRADKKIYSLPFAGPVHQQGRV
jgi:raffinose/stachyose/melibiose transport system substrate-binding protein